MDNQLGRDQNRKGNQKSRLHFYVAQEGKATNAPRKGANRCEEEKRQPRNRCNNKQPPI